MLQKVTREKYHFHERMIYLKKKLGFALLAGTLALSLAGCGDKEETKDGKEKVTFATAPDTAPFTYKDSGKLTGFDIEIIEAIAKAEDLDVEWKEMKFSGIIPALQSKQVDGAVAAITIRDDRKEVVDFVDPYFESGLAVVASEKSGIKKLEDLKGKTIVAKQSSSGLEKAKELAEKYGAKVKILEDEATLYMDVQKGGADALVNDEPFVKYKINSGTADGLTIIGEKLTTEDYGIAITKGNKELVETFNEGLEELKESGEYDKLYEEYFGAK